MTGFEFIGQIMLKNLIIKYTYSLIFENPAGIL